MSLAQLSRLLPLPDSELQQILDYAATLAKPAAAEHLSNLLGTGPQAVDFISSFNAKRKDAPDQPGPSGGSPAPASGSDGGVEPAPKGKRGKKGKADLHTPQARTVQDSAPFPGTAYNKRDNDLEYIPQSKKNSPAPSPGPEASRQQSRRVATGEPPRETVAPKPEPARTQAGYLISDPAPKAKPKSNNSSRSSTPKPSGSSTKISIAGGTPMKGASTALSDLESAIRSLELSSNPSATGDPSARRCNCVGARHPLQSAAPNCLSCGKVVCVKEGLGPCTFCGSPILTTAETEAILQELKAERSREKQAVHRSQHKKADVSRAPAPFSAARDDFQGKSLAEAEARAREHRDRLLGYQAQNAKRTTVRDEVADFDVEGAMGGRMSLWASPEERALELKRQQRLLREMEWEAKPEWEKRKEVVSIDLVGGKVVRKMAPVERPATPEEEPEEEDAGGVEDGVLSERDGNRRGGGTFSRNPLMGAMIRPVYSDNGKEKGKERERTKGPKWRRVQDDLDDNEEVILDGGIYGHSEAEAVTDEPSRG
ncbi:hypothetical protein VUR80DRAFT_4150 [Thermomyces stellatus]